MINEYQISINGKTNGHFDIWACPTCGKTERVNIPTYYVPNLVCNCAFPDHVTQKIRISNGVI